MGKKHVNDDKPAGYGGRSTSGAPKPKPSENVSKNRSGRERNVGKDEEHSRVRKGKQG